MGRLARNPNAVLVKIKFTDAMRRHECQVKLKLLKDKLAAKDRVLDILEACEAEVNSREANIASIQKKVDSAGRQLRFQVHNRYV